MTLDISLPGRLGLIGALHGLPVRPADPSWHLRYDEMYLEQGGVIRVGEVEHFTYRLRQLSLNEACRKAAREHIKNSAERILGESWELS